MSDETKDETNTEAAVPSEPLTGRDGEDFDTFYQNLFREMESRGLNDPPSVPAVRDTKTYRGTAHINRDQDRTSQIRQLYHEALSSFVLGKLNAFEEPDEIQKDGAFLRDSAQAYMSDLQTRMRPRDALEILLIEQMAWTHHRLARLTCNAAAALKNPSINQAVVKRLAIILDACDRTTNTFRRQLLAFAEYREPRRALFAKHANLANQQIVQQDFSENSKSRKKTNELEKKHARKALPALGPGTSGAQQSSTADRSRPRSLAVLNGTKNSGRKKTIGDERSKARSSVSRVRGSASRIEAPSKTRKRSRSTRTHR